MLPFELPKLCGILLLAASVAAMQVGLRAQTIKRFQQLPRLAQPKDTMGALSTGLADLDGDGDLDVVVGNVNFIAHDKILLNDGYGRLTDVTSTHFPKEKSTASTGLGLADFDADGDIDIFIAADRGNNRGGINPVYENIDGKGHYRDATSKFFPHITAGGAFDISPADLDGDGDLDLFMGNALGNSQNTSFFNLSRQLYPSKDAVLGKPYPLDLYGPPGSQAILMLATGPGRLKVAPFGTLGLDLRSTVTLPNPIRIGSSRRATFPGSIPNISSLRGKRLFTQALLLNPKSPLRSRLTNAFFDVIH